MSEFKKFDEGKLRWNLMPQEALEEVLKVLEMGAKKYGDFNWKQADKTEWTRLLNSLDRHKVKFSKGIDFDEESGLPELAHLICNALFLLTYQIEGLGIDNRDPRLGETKNGCKVLKVVRTLGSHRVYEFQCPFCPKTFEALYNNVQKGNTKSCGCQKYLNRPIKHGMSNSKIYGVWHGMRRRCEDQKHISYKNYGGRGISVCERWQSFENFLLDMGLPEGKKDIDRIDNNGNYEPSNCRWATRKENSNNRRPRASNKK